jgi:type IV secretory pathway VirB4 component
MKIPFLVELLQVMLTEAGGSSILDPVTAKIFTNAALECYKRYGYDKGDVRTQLGATPESMPTLGDVYVMLDRMRRASRDQLFQSKIQPLCAALENFVGEGQYSGLYDHRSNVDLTDSSLTVFHVGDVSDRHLPIVMHMVLEFLRTTLFTSEQLESGQRRILYVDECQRMLQFTETAYFLSWIASTCRKYGIGLTVMTQQIGQFLWNTGGTENKVGRAVLGACSLTLLLRQHSSEIENIREAFKLTESELIRLRTIPTGQGLLLLDQDSCWFTAEHLATDEERRFLSTTAAERASFSATDSEMLELPPGEDDEDYESGGGFFQPLGPGK